MVVALAQGEEDEEEAEIVANLSGDDVDPGLIIAGGRRTRRGRGSASREAAPKYAFKPQQDSDEDSW